MAKHSHNSNKARTETAHRPRNKGELKELIEEEIEKYGPNCSLNHIDVSQITDMSDLFVRSKFTGDISQWNVSNVERMDGMFEGSSFNGDISQWNTKQVKDMDMMFYDSLFNGDISRWNTRKVENIAWVFEESQFNGDLRPWKWTEEQMKKAFGDSYPKYQAVRERKVLLDQFSESSDVKKSAKVL